ncbi:MAG TPA: SDR family oxidoreductase [Candidatus Udaeobacter sp.]|nr:SDR family oxidoreductase [Candidatus Udaeobacter sp.]
MVRPAADLFSLAGKVALVTGSSRGLGWSIAHGMARAGAHVAINARSQSEVAARVRELEDEGLSASAQAFDVADAEAATRAVAAMEAAHRRIDILVNNAGIAQRKPLAETSDADWQRVIEINLTACFRLSRLASRAMLAQGSGRIIMTTSVLAIVGRPGTSAYAAAKAGLVALTRTLAAELGARGVLCNAILPGYFATELNAALIGDPRFDAMVKGRTPLHRWGDPEELAGPVIFLASPAASYVNGHVLVVDGGMSVSVGTEI